MTPQPILPPEKKAPPMAAEPPAGGPKDLLIASGCSQYGLYRKEIIRPKVPVDVARWKAIIQAEAAQRGATVKWQAVFPYEESEAGFWHLRLYWKEIETTTDTKEHEGEIHGN